MPQKIIKDAYSFLNRFIYTMMQHLYHEDNQVADRLVEYGHGFINQKVWEREYNLPTIILLLVQK